MPDHVVTVMSTDSLTYAKVVTAEVDFYEVGSCKVSNSGYITGYVTESSLSYWGILSSYGHVAVHGSTVESHSRAASW